MLIKATDKAFGRNGLAHMLVACAALLIIYFTSGVIAPGLLTWAISMPAVVVVGITAVARANDIQKENSGFVWEVRKFGLALTAGACMFVVLQPFTDSDPVSWRTVLFCYGVALCWMTTPGGQPWIDYITGAYKNDDPPKLAKNFHGRVTGQFPVVNRDTPKKE